MSKLPQSVSEGHIDLGDFVLRFHVLDNGKKVIEAEDLERFVELLTSGKLDITEEQVKQMEEFIKELS